jgi:hypothetical protein
MSSDIPSRPVGRARLRRVSGRVAAVWLVICLLLTAILIPMALRLPRWIEFEIVLLVWWVLWRVDRLSNAHYEGGKPSHSFGGLIIHLDLPAFTSAV